MAAAPAAMQARHTPAHAGLPFLLAQAGQALVAPGLDQAAKPANPVANLPGAKMAENFANAPAGGAAPPPAATTAATPTAGGTQAALIKYAPSYVLMLLLVGLGLFIICRPYSIAEDKIE